MTRIKKLFPHNVSEQAFITALVLLTIASLAFWMQKSWGDQVVTSDPAFYEEVALNFLNGEGFTRDGLDSGMLPGYPFFLASVFRIAGHNLDAVRIAQGILFILTVFLSYQLGKILVGVVVARYAALFLAVFYPLPIAAGFLGREVLITFTLVLVAYTLTKLYDTEKLKWIIFSGLLLGAFVWVADASKFLIIPVFLAFLIMFRNTGGLKSLLGRSALFIGAFSIFFGLAILYSINQYNSVGLSQRGMVLYYRAEIMESIASNYPGHLVGHLFGYYFAERLFPGIDVRLFREEGEYSLRGRALIEQGYSSFERDNIMFEEGLQKIKENPFAYAFMSGLDFLSLNSPVIPHGEKWVPNYMLLTFTEGRHENIPGFVKAGYLLSIRGLWYAMMASAIFFAIRELRRDWRKIIFIVIILLYFNAVYSMTHAIPRYAVPLYPLYIIFATGGVALLWQKIKQVI